MVREGNGNLEAPRREASHEALERQNDSLRQTIAFVDRLTAMALEGSDVEQIATELASWIDAEVAIFDELFRPMVAISGESTGEPTAIAPLEDPRVAELVETVRHTRLPVRVRAAAGFVARRDCVIAPIASGERVLGFVVSTTGAQGQDEDLQLMTIQHATSICALAFVQNERDEELRLRYRSEFVESLLSATLQSQKAIELARLAGLVAEVAYEAIAIGPVDPDAGYEQLFSRLALALQQLGAGFAAVARADHVVLLAPVGDGADTRALERNVAEVVRRALPNVAIALGSSRPIAERSELRLADVQARRALSVARRLRRAGEVTPHETLGIHRLLLHVPLDELAAFAHEVLGALLEHGPSEENPLLETLTAYVRENGNVRPTAETLLVHPNTVSYRLRRIEELTGLSLHDANDRMLAAVAVEVVRTLP